MKSSTFSCLKNESGLSLISVLGIVAVLGGATFAVMKLSSMSVKGIDTSSRKMEAISLTSTVKARLKSLFLDTKASNGSLVGGVCSLVGVDNSDTQIGNAWIRLPNSQTSPLFSDAEWNRAFSGLTPVTNDPRCSLTSKYGRCYQLSSQMSSSLGISEMVLKKLEPLFEINIKPLFTNPATDEVFTDINPDGNKKYDVKAIGFEYKIRASYKSSAEEHSAALGRNFIQGVIWAGDAGACHVSNKKLSLTANTLGVSDNSIILNQAGFTSDSVSRSTSTPLNIVLQHTQVRSGIVGKNKDSNYLVSVVEPVPNKPYDGPAHSSCNENRFRCPQLDSNGRNYRFMRQMLKASYQIPNQLTQVGNYAQIAPKTSFKNSATGRSIDGYAESYTIGNDVYTKGNDGWYYAGKKPLRIGGVETLIAGIADFSDGQSANKVCREICVRDSNYNTDSRNNYQSIFSYKVQTNSKDPKIKDTFEAQSEAVACTSCWMKNCDIYGLRVWGAMHLQPTEPLDAGVPECVVHEDHASNFYETQNFNMGAANASKCIAARLNTSSEGISLSAHACAETKPVLCFAFGRHMLGKSLTLNNSSTASKNFADARELCFEQSWESIKKKPLKKLFDQQNNLNEAASEFLGIGQLPKDKVVADADLEGRVDIFNFITQGMFLAPVGKNQESVLRENALKHGEVNQIMNTPSWINLRTDNLGFVYAPAPIIPQGALNPANQWGVYYNGSGTVEVQKVSNSLNLSTENAVGPKVALLFHGPRFKGIHFVKNSKPFQNGSGTLRVLCRRTDFPHNAFIASERVSDFSSAENSCKKDRGLFLPPLTSTGWVQALHLVAANHEMHSFPRIWNPQGLDPVWVNLVEGNGIDIGTVLEGSLSRFTNAKGQFIAETFSSTEENGKKPQSDQEKANHMRACLNQTRGAVEFNYECGGGSRQLTREEVIAISSPDNMYLRFMLKTAFAKYNRSENVQLYE